MKLIASPSFLSTVAMMAATTLISSAPPQYLFAVAKSYSNSCDCVFDETDDSRNLETDPSCTCYSSSSDGDDVFTGSKEYWLAASGCIFYDDDVTITLLWFPLSFLPSASSPAFFAFLRFGIHDRFVFRHCWNKQAFVDNTMKLKSFDCVKFTVIGEWKQFATVTGSSTQYSYTVGYQTTNTVSKSYTETVKGTASVQMTAIGGTVGKLSTEVSHSVTKATESSMTTREQETFTTTYDSSYTGQSLWQWQYTVIDADYKNTTLKTNFLAVTDGVTTPPLCPAGYQANMDENYQQCIQYLPGYENRRGRHLRG